MAERCLFPNCRITATGKGFCPGHASYAGISLNDTKPKLLPPKSSKRKIDEKEYRIKGKAFLKANPKCEGKFTGCTKISTTIHHRRGRVGSDYLDERTWLACCMSCHQQIELNPNQAKEKGLSENRLV